MAKQVNATGSNPVGNKNPPCEFESHRGHQMDDRYQHQKWYVKLWRRRYYIPIPYYALVNYIKFRLLKDDDAYDFRMCWSISKGLAQVQMKWYYDFDEVKDRIKRKQHVVVKGNRHFKK